MKTAITRRRRKESQSLNALGRLIFVIGYGSMRLIAENPLTYDKPWHSSNEVRQEQRLKTYPEPRHSTDAIHVYTLAKLIDLAESHNPETRAAWLNAKAEATSVGVSKAAFFPTVTAVALAYTSREGTLVDAGFHRQTIGLFQPTLNLNYLTFDFGRRSGIIAEIKVNLIAADFAFNDTHRKLIYEVTAGYYRLQNALGQQDAAQATLVNAQTVQKDAEARLNHGLATLPDVLEARAAAAQADYDLQAALGAERWKLRREIWHRLLLFLLQRSFASRPSTRCRFPMW